MGHTYSMRKENIFVFISHWDFRVVEQHNSARPDHPPALPAKHIVTFPVLHMKKQKIGRLISLSYKFRPRKYGCSVCAFVAILQRLSGVSLPFPAAPICPGGLLCRLYRCCLETSPPWICGFSFLVYSLILRKLSKRLIGKETWEVNFWRAWILKNSLFFSHCDG